MIERLQRKLRPSQLAKDPAGSRPLENVVADLGGEVLENRGPHQESETGDRNAREKLIPHVVGHEPVIAAELGRIDRRSVPISERQSRQVERRRPALSSLVERLDLAGGEAKPNRLQQRLALGSAHCQIPPAELEHLAMGAHSAQGQSELAPRDEGDLAFWRERRDRVAQRRQRALGAKRVGLIDPYDERAAPGAHGVECPDQAIQQVRWPVVARLQRDQGKSPLVLLRPLGQQAALRISGRGGDEHQRIAVGLAQPRDELRPGDECQVVREANVRPGSFMRQRAHNTIPAYRGHSPNTILRRTRIGGSFRSLARLDAHPTLRMRRGNRESS